MSAPSPAFKTYLSEGDESLRLEILRDYRLLDTPAEKELDDFVQLASVMCETPVSLVSLLGRERQWFKSKIGIDAEETSREVSFCNHILGNPDEVMVVEDPLRDERFKNNPLVTGAPNIRYYAGAPLRAPGGQVLGTLCVINDRPHSLKPHQIQGLELLADKVMVYLETRKKLLEQEDRLMLNGKQLRELTNQVPGVIFELELAPDNTVSYNFISRGISRMYPGVSPESFISSPERTMKLIHREDRVRLLRSLYVASEYQRTWREEFKVVKPNGEVIHALLEARSESLPNGRIVWRGLVQDISSHVDYEKTLEEITFDISHVLRKPVTNLLGLTEILSYGNVSEEDLLAYNNHIRVVSTELELFTQKLSKTYSEKEIAAKRKRETMRAASLKES